MTYSLAAAAAAVDQNKTQHPAHQKGGDSSHDERTTLIVHPRPMSSAPLDGTPVRLFVFAGSFIASFWSEERCQETFGVGDYRAGWYLLDDDAIELDDPLGWQPLTDACARFENETGLVTLEPVLP